MTQTPRALLLTAIVSSAVSQLAAQQLPPSSPGNVIAYAPNQSRVHLSWIDVANETSYSVQRWNGAAWVTLATLPPDYEVFRAAAPSTVDQEVKYRIFANNAQGSSVGVEAVVQKPSGALDLMFDDSRNDPSTGFPPLEIPEGTGLRAGVPFSLQIEVYGGTPDLYTVRDLPAGLSFDENTGVISGTLSEPGVYRMFTGVTFDTDKNFEQLRYLRVLPGVSTPVVNVPDFSLPTQAVGVNGFVNLSNLFVDPERPLGARFYTGGAIISFVLFDTATPKTVYNFLGYALRGDYDGTFFHRSIPNFITQGGGYTVASATSPITSWKKVTAQAPVQNEPGISNVPGTISMAKLGGTRDSATSEYFFNLGTENPDNLDYQNGGFSAFGTVLGTESAGILDLIEGLQTESYSITVTGSGTSPFSAIPVLGNPPSFLPVDTIVLSPAVIISVISNSAPEIIEAQMYGSELYVRSLGPLGTANLVLQATNLDGNTVNFTLPITIDEIIPPQTAITKIKPASRGGAKVYGKAVDDVALRSWSYRVNKGGWKKGGSISGKSAKFTKTIRGFKPGRNSLQIRAVDQKGNTSKVVTQRFTFK